MTELEAAYSELQKVERLRAAILSRLDHELRTPLAVITLAAGMVEPRVPEDAKPMLSMLRSSSEQLRAKIEDLLLLSRTSHSDLPVRGDRVPLAPMASLALLRQSGAARAKSISLSAVSVRADLAVRGDRPLLQSALDHLIANGVRFGRPGGRVSIEAGADDGGIVRVSVRDDGPGLPPAEKNRVFDSFYQVAEHMTREVGGLGVGLAIVRRVAEAHGGHAGVESPPGGGCSFSLALPSA